MYQIPKKRLVVKRREGAITTISNTIGSKLIFVSFYKFKTHRRIIKNRNHNRTFVRQDTIDMLNTCEDF